MFTIVLVALLSIQGITVAQTASIAQEAARNGARALSLGSPAGPAIADSLPGAVEVASVTYPSTGGVRLEVRTVDVGYLPQMTVTRFAVMPRTVP